MNLSVKSCALKILLSGIFFLSSHATAAETIRLQLKWSHQFQFAGYYAAQEQGYYKEAGLNVEIKEATTGDDPAEILLQGNAEYGVGSNSLLLLRDAGKPLIVLAVIFQHSPYALLTLQHNTTQNIHDLANKSLMIEPLADELIAYLNHEGIPLKKVKLVEYKHDIQDFISGKVDAISAYVTDEPYLLEKKGIAFYSYSPRSVGIDFYGDNLFTTDNELKNHPERVRKFREASLRGWRYAMSHQEEMIQYILQQYPNRKEYDYLLYEAEKMQQLMHPELIDIGYMLAGRWQHIARTYAELGMLPDDISLNGFLYEEDPSTNYFWFYTIIAAILFLLCIVTLVSTRFSKLNKKLFDLLHIKSRLANIGESVTNISHQWKQPLHELGIQLMLIENTLDNDSFTEKDKHDIKKITNKSHGILEFMADTVDVFGNLLKTDNKTTTFHPQKTIQKLLQLVNDNFKINGIKITSNLDENIQITGNPTELTHILLSIIINARDIIKERNISEPHLQINLYQSSNTIYIDIIDNAGGIKTAPVENIFKFGFSNKKTNESGIGLFIAKQLIEDKFGGEIHAENTDTGAVFKISIPYADKVTLKEIH